MSAPRYRLTPADLEHGRVCGCGNLKAVQHRRCKACDTDQRRGPTYWRARTCPRCGGPMSRQAARCRRCADAAKRGRPRSTPAVVPAASHPWRQRRAA